MIPILYNRDEREFSSQGVCRLYDIVRCVVTEERNGIYECEFDYPINGEFFSKIVEGAFIGVTHDDKQDIQPFEIYGYSAPINGVVTFYAHHLSYKLRSYVLKPYSASSCSGALSIMAAQSMSPCPFEFWTNKGTIAPFEIKYPVNIKSILAGEEGSILDIYGPGEFEYDKWTVKFHDHRGNDNGVEIRYGKNLTNITHEYDESEIYTAVVPYYYSEDEEGHRTLVYPEDYRAVINPDASTHPVYWTNEDDEIIRNEAGEPIEFGVDNTVYTAIDLTSEFEELPTVEELVARAQELFDENKPWEPEDNIKISFVSLWQTPEYKNIAPLEKVSLCDTVKVIYPNLNIETKTKVIKTVYNVLLDRYDSIELGDAKMSYANTIKDELKDQIAYLEEGMQKRPTSDYVNQQLELATDKIRGGLGGYIVMTPNADGQPQEILVLDRPNLEEAINVIRINRNGIGFSQNGYEGPFNSAWLIDGTFDAQQINVINLAATIIRTGLLTDAYGENFWNLDTGEFHLSMATKIGEDNRTLLDLADKAESLKEVDVEYALSDSSSEAPTEGWSTDAPEWTWGKYIWQRTKTVNGVDDVDYSSPTCIQGASGSNGVNTAIVHLYKRSASPVTVDWRTSLTYNFSTHKLTSIPSGWYDEIPEGTNPIYVTAATASSRNDTDTIAYTEWATPVILAQNGKDGKDTVVYSLSVSHAAVIRKESGSFSPASITLKGTSQSGNNNETAYAGRFKIEVTENNSTWTTAYTSTANESSKGYTIPTSNPSNVIAVRCSLYAAGGTTTLLDQQTIQVISAAKSAYTVILTNENHTFAGSKTAAMPANATCGVIGYKGTTQLATTIGEIKGAPTGMSVSIANNGTKNASFTVSVTGEMVTKNGTLSIPVTIDGIAFGMVFTYSLALKGEDGEDGDPGLNSATVFLYQRATKASSLTKPTGDIIYNFSTGAVTGSLGNWTKTVPASNGNPCFVIQATAVSANKTDTIAKTEWSEIVEFVGDGRGIKTVTEYYAVNNSSSSAPADSNFSTTVVSPTSTNRYLWNYEVIGYTDDSAVTKTTKRVIGVYGNTGKGISSITNHYLATTASSGVTKSTSGWTTTVQSVTEAKPFLWNYETVTYTDGVNSETNPCIIGAYGKQGQGVKNVREQYYLSTTSKQPLSGGQWSYDQPAWKKDYYLWMRSHITWTDDTSTYTTPYLANAINSANQAVKDLDASLNQEEVFNRLTNKGKNEGIYLDGGHLYINGSLIKTGKISDSRTNPNNYWNLNTGYFQTKNGKIANYTINENGLYNGDASKVFDMSSMQKVTPEGTENPYALEWMERSGETYVFTSDTAVDSSKTYYLKPPYNEATELEPANIAMCGGGPNNDYWGRKYEVKSGVVSYYMYDRNRRSTEWALGGSDTANYLGGVPGVLHTGHHVFTDIAVFDAGSLDLRAFKNKVMVTKDYGQRRMHCYETTSPMFGDVGEGTISAADSGSEYGHVNVYFDPIFASVIEHTGYQVFLQKYGDGVCYIEYRMLTGFRVRGTPNLSFGWEVKAKQKGYNNFRTDDYGMTSSVLDSQAVVDKILELFSKLREWRSGSS